MTAPLCTYKLSNLQYQLQILLSVNLTFELMTLKCRQCHVDLVISNSVKFHYGRAFRVR